MWLTGCCVAEEERRVRANAREYNEKFQYAVSEGGEAELLPGGPRAGLWGWGLNHPHLTGGMWGGVMATK